MFTPTKLLLILGALHIQAEKKWFFIITKLVQSIDVYKLADFGKFIILSILK